MPEQDRIRVLRLIEYEGPRDLVEKQVEKSLHGTRVGVQSKGGAVRITAITLGIYPEIIEPERAVEAPGEVDRIRVALQTEIENTDYWKKQAVLLKETLDEIRESGDEHR